MAESRGLYLIEEFGSSIEKLIDVIRHEFGSCLVLDGDIKSRLEMVIGKKFNGEVFFNKTSLIVSDRVDADFICRKSGFEELWRLDSVYYGHFMSILSFVGCPMVFNLLNK